jgi:PAS domain S-box-containing protein
MVIPTGPIRSAAAPAALLKPLLHDVSAEPNAALQKAALWFETTLKSIGEAVIATDAEGRIQFMNSIAEQLTGWSSAEAIARRVETVFQIINEKTRKPVHDPVAKVIRSGTVVGLANHTVLVGKDGKEFPIDDSGAPIRDENGHLIGVVLVFRNISARHRSEQALRESEERFRRLSECSPLGIFTTDVQGRWTYVNPGVVEMCHQPAEELLGFGWERRVPIQERETIVEEWYTAAAAGQHFSRELPLDGNGSGLRWVQMRTAPLRADSGATIGHVGTLEDVTERRRAAERLMLYRKIFEMCDEGVAIIDPDGKYIEQNAAHERITGYDQDEILSRTPASHLGDEGFRTISAELLRTGRFEGELNSHNRAGETSVLDVSAFSIHNGSGELVCNVEIDRDITHRKKIDEALASTEKLTSMGRLAATIAHEINNPITSVTNLLYLIEASPSVDDMRRYARTAQEELRRVSHICHQTLGFYRESTIPSDIDIAGLLDSVLALHGAQIRQKNITLERRYKPGLTVRALTGEMHQVFSNLIDNSVAAISDAGRIVVHAYASREWSGEHRPGVRVVIFDTGTGIDHCNYNKIFEPFFSTKGQKGTGLGLWVSKGIVQKHGGSIRLHSSTRAGKSGCCFSVFLPV